MLFVLLATLYARAFSARDELHTSIFRHDCLIATFPHHFHVILADHRTVRAYPTVYKRALFQYPPRPKYLQPRLTKPGLYWEISIPFWLPLLFASAPPLWAAGRAVIHRKRAAIGLCPTCGYDLRASTTRCPECGTLLGTSQSSQNSLTPGPTPGPT